MQKKISSPVTNIQASYEVVVIGSGYGGGIAASRMARAGKKVCLLEKGREILPGNYPNTLAEAVKQMQTHTNQGNIGDQAGLFDFHVGEGINVVKGCGLGGTSLINANVSIEPEPRVFERDAWPQAVKADMEAVFEGMKRAKEMLKPMPYPEGKQGYPLLPKTAAHKQSAAHINEEFRYLNINVNFEDQVNHLGVSQKACNNCGDCVSGCNVTAKNTTLMNYLPDAKNHGAEIYCEIAVSHIARKNNKWLVFYQLLNVGREKFDAPLMFVQADVVFLGAGSLGSTEILLRSVEKGGLSLSDKLGQRFTGNGDVLGFGYNTDQSINGIGFGEHTDIAPVGPCITSVIDVRNRPVLEDGMVIEEGSAPGAIAPLLRGGLSVAAAALGKDTDEGDTFSEKVRALKSWVAGAYKGAVNNTQIYLIMTHDDGNGKMSLKNNRLQVNWQGVGKQQIFEKADNNLLKATEALGGTYIKNPTWTNTFDYALATVHPLGGCIMGDDASKGVTNHKGQVFCGTTGTDLYEGLYVSDGAIIPCSLGTNPLLTISGFAERNCRLIAQDLGITFNYEFPTVPPKPADVASVGVMFTETMKGYFSLNEKIDFALGKTKGEAENSPLAFTLTIQALDAQAFVTDPDHEANMTGTVIAPALSAMPLVVSEGRFNLFSKDVNNEKRKFMKYNMQLNSVEGKTYYFNGFKDIIDDPGFDVWKDTTTLFITVHEGDNVNAPIAGKGMLIIEASDFAKQCTTMKALNGKTIADDMKALVSFGKLFAGNVWDTYFSF
jgi:cholesterol oxidase